MKAIPPRFDLQIIGLLLRTDEIGRGVQLEQSEPRSAKYARRKRWARDTTGFCPRTRFGFAGSYAAWNLFFNGHIKQAKPPLWIQSRRLCSVMPLFIATWSQRRAIPSRYL
jgi:hypothetical protein